MGASVTNAVSSRFAVAVNGGDVYIDDLEISPLSLSSPPLAAGFGRGGRGGDERLARTRGRELLGAIPYQILPLLPWLGESRIGEFFSLTGRRCF